MLSQLICSIHMTCRQDLPRFDLVLTARVELLLSSSRRLGPYSKQMQTSQCCGRKTLAPLGGLRQRHLQCCVD